MLTLDSLLNDAPFTLDLVTDGVPTDGRILGGHVVEMLDPGEWLAPDYLALTTGVALAADPVRQRDFVRSVSDAGSVALGFGVGINVGAIPDAILDAGRECALPILSIPYEVPFREILTYIARSTLTTGFHDYARALRMQDYLLAALEDAEVEESLTKRVADLVNGRVALFGADGRVLASAGRPPVDEMWQSIRDGGRPRVLDRKRLLSIEVRVESMIRFYVAVAVQDSDRSEAFGTEVLKFAARVAQAIALARSSAVVEERASRGGLLVALLTSAVPDYEATQRLRAFSISAREPLRLLVASSAGPHAFAVTAEATAAADDDPSDGHEPILEACESMFHELRVPYLSGVVDGRVTAIWQDQHDDASTMDVLNTTVRARSMAIGLSRRTDSVPALNQAMSEASLALAEAERLSVPTVVGYEQLRLSEIVLARSHPELTARANSILDPLRQGRPDLFETLVAYLEHDCDIIKCAKALYVHPNTLRYRLSRIEATLGRPLRSVATLTDLYLALRL